MRTILKLKADSRKEAIDALNKALDQIKDLKGDDNDTVVIRVRKVERRNYELFM